MTHTETHDTAANLAAPGVPVAPPPPPAKKGASKKKGAPRSPKTAAGGKTKAAPKTKSKAKAKAARAKVPVPRAESKGAQILALIRRSKGATLAEIQKTTGWQAHSVRGYLSSAATKHNLRIESTKNETGDRVYHTQS